MVFQDFSWHSWTRWILRIAFASQGSFLFGVAHFTFTPLLPFYVEKLGFGASGVGIAAACLQVGWLISLPGQPWLLDRLGVRHLILVAIGCYGCAPLIFGTWRNIAGLSVARVCEGIGVSLLMPTLDAHLTRMVPEASRGKAFGARSIFAVSGKSFGIIASLYLDPLGGLSLILLTMGAIAGALFFANCMVPQSWFTNPRSLSQEGHRDVDATRTNVERFRDFLRMDMALLWLLHFTMVFNRALVFVVLPFHMSSELGFAMVATSMAWFLAELFQIPVGMLGGFVADTLDPLRWTIGTCIAQCLMLFAITSPDLTRHISTQQYPHAGFVALFVMWMTMNSTVSPFLLPLFAKLSTMTEATCGESAYEELWVANHIVCALGLMAGGLVGGFAYRALEFHFLIRGSAGVAMVVAIVVGLLLPRIVARAAGQPERKRLVQSTSPGSHI